MTVTTGTTGTSGNTGTSKLTEKDCEVQSAAPTPCSCFVPRLLNTTVIKKYGRKDKIFNVQCCPPKLAVPPEYSCFWPKIFDQFETLLRRQYCMQTKNPIIHEMALPKFMKPKYVKPCYCFKPVVEIHRLYEREPTRTQQLALPRIRDFMSLKNGKYYKTFPQLRKDAILRNMRKSYYSLYTYLSNNKLYCMKKPIREKPSKKKLRKFKARLAALAEPKEIPEPPEPEKKDGESDPARVAKLAKPKQYPVGHEKGPWQLKPRQRTYVATAKILEMARPKEYYPDNNNPDYDKVDPKALKYRATEKIKEMAQPVIRPKEDSNLKENPFQISPNALKAVASARVKELAEPKEYEDTLNKADPFAISPKALRAVASPRICALAKPKQYAF